LATHIKALVLSHEGMNDMNEYDDEPQAWAKGSMNFNVAITNAQEDFFVREVADRMAETISRDMIKRMEDATKELVEVKVMARLEEVVTDVINKGLSAELQPSDEFSTPKGQPITPLEFIAKGAENFLDGHVNDRGEATSKSNYGNSTSRRIDYFMRGVVTKQFDDELKKEVVAMKNEIRGQMKSAAAEWLAKFQAETVAGVEGAKALQLRT
jgi:hypothetical protein